jgi:sec-independent protein translocase protein TatA
MFGNLNPMELMVVLGVAVLLFGKRLPEVGRTLGKGIVEFKKGIRGLEDEFRLEEPSHYRHPEPAHTPSDLVESSVPKFEPPRFDPPTSAPARQDVPAQS